MRFLAAISAALLIAVTPSATADSVGSGWTLGVACPPKGSDGAGAMSASTTGGFGAAGTCRRVKGLFTKLTFETYSGATLRSTTAFSLQTPSVLITPPLLTTESQPIFSVANACPVSLSTIDLNWLFVQWNDAERRALADTNIFGTATYSKTNGVVVTGQYGINGSVYFSGPRPMAGTCTNGVYTATNAGAEQDADGKIYFNAAGMGAYKTTAGRATFFFPRYTITAATHFGSKTFQGLSFDSDTSNGVSDVRQIKGSANAAGTVFTLQPLSDPENDIVDSSGSAYTDTVTFAGANINSPAPGMLFGTVTRTGSGAGSGRVGCIANALDSDTIVLCSGESPTDNLLPFHFSLYAPNIHNKGSGPNGNVSAVALDGNGKLYLGGSFSAFNGTAVGKVARQSEDGTLDPGFTSGLGFNAAPNSFALAPTGKLYASGVFSSYDGTSSKGIARLNLDGSYDTTFDVGTGFNPTQVNTIAVDSAGKVYAGGNFSTYKGVARSCIARLESNGDLDTTFTPGAGADGFVTAIAVDPSTGKVYIGGFFSNVDGSSRSKIARLNANGTLDTLFVPGTGFNNTVMAIAVDPSSGKVYVSGAFTTFNGVGRAGIARLTTTGALDTAFDPGAGFNATPNVLLVDGATGKVTAGGAFSTYNGTSRGCIARLSTGGSLDTAFNPGTGCDGTILSMRLDGTGKIYLGGAFFSYNGSGRSRVAVVNADGSLAAGFNQSSAFSSQVNALGRDESSGKVYAGGFFLTFNGVSRPRVARLNGDGSLDNGFNPGTGFDASPLAFAPDTASGKVYVGGGFTTFNAASRKSIARLNDDGSLDTTFDPGTGFSHDVNAVALDAATGKLYAAGVFTSYNGTARNRIVRLNANGSLDTTYVIGTGFNNTVRALVFDGATGKLYAAGNFTQYNTVGRNRIARLNDDGSLDTSYDPGSGFNSQVSTLALDPVSGKLFAGGPFTSFNGTGRVFVARLNATGSLDTGFDPGVSFNNYVASLAVDPSTGKLYAGGIFTQFGGVTRNYLIRLNADGTHDATFDTGTGFTSQLFAVVFDGSTGKLYAGGASSTYGSTAIDNFARLTYTGALD